LRGGWWALCFAGRRRRRLSRQIPSVGMGAGMTVGDSDAIFSPSDALHSPSKNPDDASRISPRCVMLKETPCGLERTSAFIPPEQLSPPPLMSHPTAILHPIQPLLHVTGGATSVRVRVFLVLEKWTVVGCIGCWRMSSRERRWITWEAYHAKDTHSERAIFCSGRKC
jgi:hypothetical protein